MKIAVNTRLLLKDKLTGVGWFTYESLKRITSQHNEHQFYFIFDRPFANEFIFSSSVTPIELFPPTRHPFLWHYWFEYAIPSFFRKLKPDLFLSPDGYLSLSTNVKSIPVIHDINFHHFPKDLPFWVRRYCNYYFPKFAKKAERIVTVSEYSKKDISQSYQIDENMIDVVYNGSNKLYKPLSNNEIVDTKNKIAKGCDYFVFIGMLHPRKNVHRLLEAFEAFKKSMSTDIKMIIVGEKMYLTGDIEKTYNKMQYKKDVIFVGRQNPENLKYILGSSLALTFVPYFEGFGIPILEAMNCNIPVITSETTSMPEVAGEAALFVNPYSIESIKNAMIKIASDKPFCDYLKTKANEQKEKFSWDKTANALWKTIEKCLK